MPVYTVIVESREQHVIEVAAPSAEVAGERAWIDGEVISSKELDTTVTDIARSDESPRGREYRRWQEDLQECRERVTWLASLPTMEKKAMTGVEVHMRVKKLLESAHSPEQERDARIVQRDVMIYAFAIPFDRAQQLVDHVNARSDSTEGGS